MYKVSYEDIVRKIIQEKNLSHEEIEERITKKIQQLNELISKDGAAYIVANELGIKIFDLNKKRYKVNELIIGMTSMEVLVKVVQKYDVIEFKKENRQGKVQSLLVGDETGVIRLVIWDESQLKSIEDVTENNILLIKNGYMKENNGFKEIHLSKYSSVKINPENEFIGDVIISMQKRFQRKKIKDLNVGDNVSIAGTIVQLFEPKFYNACPECNRKINLEGEKYKCDEHGFVKENLNPILNLFFDDGTENIRVVAFRNNVARILGLNNEDVKKLKDDINKFMEIRERILGSQIIINGKANKNEMFDRIEFIADSVEEINVKEEINYLLSNLK
ncbi:hypothetical protein HYX17_00735 [Candidatus Woesearchaeota archaeon]|nr:hypothetical protein [Candidatus Woesearchaeota archaeon]